MTEEYNIPPFHSAELPILDLGLARWDVRAGQMPSLFCGVGPFLSRMD